MDGEAQSVCGGCVWGSQNICKIIKYNQLIKAYYGRRSLRHILRSRQLSPPIAMPMDH